MESVPVCWAVLTNCHSLGSLSSIYCHRSGGGKSDIGCRQVWFLPDADGHCLPVASRASSVCAPLVSVVLEGCQACWVRGSPNDFIFDFLLKYPVTDTATLGVRTSVYEFWGDTTQSIAVPFPAPASPISPAHDFRGFAVAGASRCLSARLWALSAGLCQADAAVWVVPQPLTSRVSGSRGQ